MRFSVVLALTLAALTMAASAQKHQKPKTKPTYTEEKQAKGASRAVKAPAEHSSTAQELRRVEQSGAKASATHKGGNQAHLPPALKEKKETNPPISVSGASHPGHANKGSKKSDPYKGRLRHKGSHK
jgi:hypothetical protein